MSFHDRSKALEHHVPFSMALRRIFMHNHDNSWRLRGIRGIGLTIAYFLQRVDAKAMKLGIAGTYRGSYGHGRPQ
jgi:hypothetical protein